MAEDMGDKTEKPTPRRRAEARDQGNIARSPDLSASVVILGLMMMLNWYGPALVKALKTLMEEVFSGRVLGDTNLDNLFTLLLRMILLMARGPKSRFAVKARLPANHTSAGYVTIAVLASTILAFGVALSGPPGVNSTLRMTGDGIWPSCRTVTAVRRPEVFTDWIEPSTDSVVNSQ